LLFPAFLGSITTTPKLKRSVIRLISIHTCILLLLVASPPNHMHARDELILSLDEVIGKPPERPEGLSIKERDTFYSITQWAEGSEMKELIDTQERGIVLTDEQQEIVIPSSNACPRPMALSQRLLCWIQKSLNRRLPELSSTDKSYDECPSRQRLLGQNHSGDDISQIIRLGIS
jgi:hypothetical protein